MQMKQRNGANRRAHSQDSSRKIRAVEKRWLCHGRPPGGVSDVWQAKDLRKGDFGSVATAGLMGEISEVWQ